MAILQEVVPSEAFNRFLENAKRYMERFPYSPDGFLNRISMCTTLDELETYIKTTESIPVDATIIASDLMDRKREVGLTVHTNIMEYTVIEPVLFNACELLDLKRCALIALMRTYLSLTPRGLGTLEQHQRIGQRLCILESDLSRATRYLIAAFTNFGMCYKVGKEYMVPDPTTNL